MTYRFATLNDLLAVLHGIPDRTSTVIVQDLADVPRVVTRVEYEPADDTNMGGTVWIVTEEM